MNNLSKNVALLLALASSTPWVQAEQAATEPITPEQVVPNPNIPDPAYPDPRVGIISGRVVDDSKQALPGAYICIDSLKTGDVSDVNGFYSIKNLKPGTYKVTASYIGYDPYTITLVVADGKVTENDITLSEGLQMDEVLVVGAFSGQRKDLNMQKNNIGITNVVSANQVGKFPDSNIGDALKRINGINVQYDQGEARFGQVRGTSADLTSVTVNGNRLPSAEGGTRNVQLDLIPSDMVQTIEVNKVVTSDMDGDAIGGAINLVTKNTPYSRVFNATAGSGYNVVSNKMYLNLGLTYGDRFFNNRLGIMAAASYQYSPGGSDNTEFEYDVDDDGNVYLDKAQVRQYYVTRTRQSYSLAADYKFNANHRISFKGIYNRRGDEENRYRITYKKLNEKASKQSIVLQTKAGDADNDYTRLELQQTMDYTLDGQHTFGNLNVDWAASYSRATEDRPQERYFGVAMKGKNNSDYFSDLTFSDAGGRHPSPSKSIGSLSNYNWSIDELTNADQTIAENEYKLRLNFELPLYNGPFGNTLKFGAKYQHKDKERETHCYDFADAYESTYGDDWLNHTSKQIRNGFMVSGNYPKQTSFVSRTYLGNLNLNTADANAVELYEEASGNYQATEAITAAYLRTDQKLWNNLNMVLGLRMEHTTLDYSGYNWVVDDASDEQGRLDPTGHVKNHYTNWLPSALFKYNVSNDLKMRASFTRTLSRPKYSALVPCISYNVAEETASFGNADLKPTTASNFDFSGEYYFQSVGLISLGFFYKDVQDVIVDEKWKSSSDPNIPDGLLNEDGEAVKYEITQPINAYDANLFGVEFAYQRDFSFIAPAWKSLGFYGTYTYTHSATKHYKFQHRTVADDEEIGMSGSPEHTANASLYYEKKGLNLRLSYNYASAFVDEFGTEAALDRYYDAVNYLDFNASYTFGKRLKTTIYAEATNLLNQPLRYYQGTKDRTMQVEYYGVRVNAGIKIQL